MSSEKNIENRKIMARNIQKYLDKIGITKAELARRMDLPYMTVSGWVNGTSYPRIDKIEKMSMLFHCEKSDLIEDKSDVKKSALDDLILKIEQLDDGDIISLENIVAGMLCNPKYTKKQKAI